METVLRGLTIYGFLLLVFRMSGKRSLAEITNFDFVLLLIIAETTQQALLGEDFSVTNALLLILTLVCAEIALTLVKQRFPRLDHALEGKPVVLVENGKVLHGAMHQERVDLDDVLEAARRWRGLERIDQIKLAILEKDGNISVIAAPADRSGRSD
jgi:uncharacterized membrane protein YcaP (DUF421 family)